MMLRVDLREGVKVYIRCKTGFAFEKKLISKDLSTHSLWIKLQFDDISVGHDCPQ